MWTRWWWPPLPCGPRGGGRSRPAPVLLLLFFLALHSLVLGGGRTHAEHEREAAAAGAAPRGLHKENGLAAGQSLFAAAAIVVLVTNETLPDRIAAFGPRLTDPPGLVAQLISVAQIDPENQKGCRPLLAAATPPPAAGPWIAMIERGGCSFIEKVRNMQASRANAVIVGDPERNGLVTMFASGDRSDVTIPSVFVAQTQYQQLRHFVSVLAQAGGSGLKVPLLVMLVKEDMFQPMLDVIIITVITPVAMLLFIYALYRVRSTNVDRSTSDLAAPAFVSSLPTKIYFATKRRGREPVDCAICLEDYVDEEELRILPCGHEFHVECIDPWLTKRRRCCPICKANVCSGEVSPLLGFRYVQPNSTPFTPGSVRASRIMRNSQQSPPSRLARIGPGIFTNVAPDPRNSTSSAAMVSSSARFPLPLENVAPPLSPNTWMLPALVLPPSYGALAQRHASEEGERGLEERRGMPASGGHTLLPHARAASFRPAQFADL